MDFIMRNKTKAFDNIILKNKQLDRKKKLKFRVILIMLY